MDRIETTRTILGRVSGRAPAELEERMHLMADLGIDSPQALRLLIELEEGLGVEISDEDAARMETVGDVLAYVEGLDG